MSITVEEVLKQYMADAVYLPSPVQDYVASVISRAHQAAIETLPLEQRPKDVLEFYQGNSDAARALRTKVQNTPVNMAGIKFNLYDSARYAGRSYDFPQGFEAALKTGMGEVLKAHTIKDLQQVLMRSIYPAIGSVAEQRAKNGGDALELIQQGSLGALEVTPGFNPQKGSFERYIQHSGALNWDINFQRQEQLAHPPGTVSVEAMLAGQDDEGNGMDIEDDPERVEWAMPDLEEFTRRQAARRLQDVTPINMWVQEGGESLQVQAQSIAWGAYGSTLPQMNTPSATPQNRVAPAYLEKPIQPQPSAYELNPELAAKAQMPRNLWHPTVQDQSAF